MWHLRIGKLANCKWNQLIESLFCMSKYIFSFVNGLWERMRYMLCRHETISLWYLPRKKLSTMMPQLNSYYDMPASNLIVMCIYLTCFNEKKTVKELSATSTTMYYLLSNFLHSDSGREIGKVSRPIYSVASEQYLQSSHNLNLVFNVQNVYINKNVYFFSEKSKPNFVTFQSKQLSLIKSASN